MSVVTRTRAGKLEIVNTFKGLTSAQWHEDGTGGFCHQETKILSAALKTMNATPVTVVSAPPAGYAAILDGALLYLTAGTAYAAGGNLAFKYTNGSGLQVAGVTEAGFLDQTSAAFRWVNAYRAASSVSDIVAVAATPIVLQTLTAELTTGTGDLRVRAFYRLVPTTLVF
jgi:phosphoketolase